MTTLVAIQTINSRGPSAFVLLSDSRLTAINSKPSKVICDQYKKTYCSPLGHYVVAFAGHNQPAEAAIESSIGLLENWHSPAPSVLIDELGAAIENVLRQRASSYRVSILHATCDPKNNEFLAEEITFDPEAERTVRRRIDFRQKQATASVAGRGTGLNRYAEALYLDQNLMQVRMRGGPLTAAEHVQKFSQFVASQEDPSTGGFVQGVTLNIDGTAKPIAFRYGEEFFLFGKKTGWNELRGNQQIELRSLQWDFLSHRDGDIKGRRNKGSLGKLQ